MSFRAAVLTKPNEPMTVEDVELDSLQPDEVLVRIGATSLCHTDLEVIEGQLKYPMPIVLGHEAAGTIEAVGDRVAGHRHGERVVLSWNPHCGSCAPCQRGQQILCEPYLQLAPRAVHFDGSARLRHNDQPVQTMFYMSAFAEYAVVNSGCAIPLPSEIPLDRACLLGCAVMTGVGAATNVANVRPGDSVLVIGSGAIGLSAIQGARLAGASTIIATDLEDDKLVLAKRVGATHTLNATHESTLDFVRGVTSGNGVDCVLESAGSNAAFRVAVESARPGGDVVWLGKVGVDDEVSFRWGSLMSEKRITRSSYGNPRPSRDFPALANAYLAGDLLLDELITQRIDLTDINAGFDDLKNGRAIRSVIVFD